MKILGERDYIVKMDHRGERERWAGNTSLLMKDMG